MSYSKAKGTAFETAIVKYLIDCGFTDARRVALGGASGDKGDIHLGEVNNPYFVIECKNYAKELPYKMVEDFVMEAKVEYVNAHSMQNMCMCDYLPSEYCRALLIVKRINLGVADSWLIWTNKYNVTLRCRLGDVVNKENFIDYPDNVSRFKALENMLKNV